MRHDDGPSVPSLAPPADSPTEAEAHRAALALLFATVLWGCGFTWAKAAGEAVHRAAGLPDGQAFGPVFALACRFTLGGLAILLIRRARHGWTWRGAAKIAGTGLILALGLVLQHLGLDRTPEAVSAFLTSLTILFVPLTLTLVLRRPPAPIMWLGVVLATAGVWLMTGFSPRGFAAGESLGIACAVAFTFHLLAVNAVARTQDAWRLTAGQFLVVGLVCFATCAVVPGRTALWSGDALRDFVTQRAIWQNVALLALFPTVGAFSIQSHVQPKLDPTRAALIYLLEPVVAAAFAWAVAGRALSWTILAGAGLILAANILVELLAARGRAAQAGAAVTAPASSPR